jgi:hypothetical protein
VRFHRWSVHDRTGVKCTLPLAAALMVLIHGAGVVNTREFTFAFMD